MDKSIIFVEQTALVEQLIESGFFALEDCYNDTSLAHEWWAVSETLVEKLIEKGEPVIASFEGCWWGRTVTTCSPEEHASNLD